MQEFLKEWGPAIITAAAVLILTTAVYALGGQVQTGLSNLITSFEDAAKTNPGITYGGSGGTILGAVTSLM